MFLQLHDLVALAETKASSSPWYLQVWVHNAGLGSLIYLVEQICDSSGEDPSCSRYKLNAIRAPILIQLLGLTSLTDFFTFSAKRSVKGNSISDHLEYFGVSMEAETWGSCGIVFYGNVAEYQVDIAGNIVLSKWPSASSALPQGEEANRYVVSNLAKSALIDT